MEDKDDPLDQAFGFIGDMVGALFGALGKLTSFLLWVLLAIIILPAVFIAGTVYPWWVEWGEDF